MKAARAELTDERRARLADGFESIDPHVFDDGVARAEPHSAAFTRAVSEHDQIAVERRRPAWQAALEDAIGARVGGFSLDAEQGRDGFSANSIRGQR